VRPHVNDVFDGVDGDAVRVVVVGPVDGVVEGERSVAVLIAAEDEGEEAVAILVVDGWHRRSFRVG